MGQGSPVEFLRHQKCPALFRAHGRHSARTSVDRGVTVIDDDDSDILRQIERLFNPTDQSPRVVQITTVRMLPVHTVNQRFPLVIGLEAEGLVPIPMGLHLLAEKGLNVADFVLYPLHHLRAKRAVVGQEVEEAYGAGFANVEIGKPLGCGAGAIAAPLLIIERQAVMQAVGRWRRSMEELQRREKQTEQSKKSGTKNRGFHGEGIKYDCNQK